MSERPAYPTDLEVTLARIEEHALETFVALPGRVQSYDAATQTADVVPLVRHPVPQPDGTHTFEALPVVPSCPVVFPRSGGWCVAFALQPGDTVQLLVETADIGRWRVGDGSVQDPGDLRRQHITHAVAVPGLYTRGRALARAPACTGARGALAPTDAAMVIGSDAGAGRITLRPNGAVEIAQGSTVVALIDPDGTVHLGGNAGSFVALANVVDNNFSNFRTWANGHTHSGVTTGAGTSGSTVAQCPAAGDSSATKTKAT